MIWYALAIDIWLAVLYSPLLVGFSAQHPGPPQLPDLLSTHIVQLSSRTGSGESTLRLHHLVDHYYTLSSQTTGYLHSSLLFVCLGWSPLWSATCYVGVDPRLCRSLPFCPLLRRNASFFIWTYLHPGLRPQRPGQTHRVCLPCRFIIGGGIFTVVL